MRQRMNDDRSDQAPNGDLAPDGEDARVKALDARLKAARQRYGTGAGPRVSDGADANYRAGNRVLADLLGGLAGGLFLGWLIDQFAGTRPWGLLVMMVFGIFVAFRNIVRHSGQGGG
jgi:ATP synthase protein I